MSIPIESRTAVEQAFAALPSVTLSRAPDSHPISRTTPLPFRLDQTAAPDPGLDGLRAAVVAFARDAHAAGTSSEQVLIQLKRMQVDAHDHSVASIDTRALRQDIVRWAIDGYYGSCS